MDLEQRSRRENRTIWLQIALRRLRIFVKIYVLRIWGSYATVWRIRTGNLHEISTPIQWDRSRDPEQKYIKNKNPPIYFI